jgi:hypothetical protein
LRRTAWWTWQDSNRQANDYGRWMIGGWNVSRQRAKPASRKETPAEIMGRLNREINACLVNPEIKAQLIGLGATALVLSPGDFGKLMAADIEK